MSTLLNHRIEVDDLILGLSALHSAFNGRVNSVLAGIKNLHLRALYGLTCGAILEGDSSEKPGWLILANGQRRRQARVVI